MKIAIAPLTDKIELIAPLAKAYQHSYNHLSMDYKSKEEMALYTRDIFVNKLKRFAADEKSHCAVLMVDEAPMGFIRISPIPEYYKQNNYGITSEREFSEMDGYQFGWERKIKFDRDIKLDERTLIINQIYLDPSIQRQGIGSYLLEQTLPQLKKHGYENLILEYNAHNKNAEKFYETFGFKAFAQTKDFDHIVQNSNGKPEFCISDVKIAHTSIDHSLKCVQNQKNKLTQKLLAGVMQHAKGNAK